jgi:hypothetical protein
LIVDPTIEIFPTLEKLPFDIPDPIPAPPIPSNASIVEFSILKFPTVEGK